MTGLLLVRSSPQSRIALVSVLSWAHVESDSREADRPGLFGALRTLRAVVVSGLILSSGAAFAIEDGGDSVN